MQSSKHQKPKYVKGAVLGTVGALSLLAVSTQNASAATITVKAGDTVWNLAKQAGVSVSDFEAANPGIKKISSSVDLIYAGQKLNLSAGSTTAPTSSDATSNNGSYTVQTGDTLTKIASKFGVSVDVLAQNNNIADKNLILTGQVLNLASSASSSSAAVTDSSAVSETSEVASSAVADSEVASSSAVAESSTAPEVTSDVAEDTTSSAVAAPVESTDETASSAAATPVESTDDSTTPVADTPATSSATETNSDLQSGSVVSLAVKLASANIPYVWGGSSLSGMDCSGLVAYVFANAEGKSLSHYTVSLESEVTQKSVSEAQPGDLLFWGDHGSTYHVAIYIGNNQYVAAPEEGENVQIQTISPYFAPSFAGTVN